MRPLLLPILLLSACAGVPGRDVPTDPHSYANPAQVRVRHLVLDLDVSFERRVLSGTAELRVERLDPRAQQLVLDTRDLNVFAVEAAAGPGAWTQAPFSLGPADAVLGSALYVGLPPGADRVRIRYATRPQASGLQWLDPAQTAGRQKPFLFSQSEAIHARSWIPLQDTPQVRLTYEARIRTPDGLRAVMAAEHGPVHGREFSFAMRQPIPSYLVALAVGELSFRRIGPRTGVYAEPVAVAAAAHEFEDAEKMLAICESRFGPYRWGRYDLLILPPSFPYGGMENPRLTFATPLVVVGDKSLVALVAHELAHSWSGNLVTNATWRDFWLNEGTTTYLTYRIMDAVYGQSRGDMERVNAWNDLQEALGLAERPGDRALAVDASGRNPDDVLTTIQYVRGERFLTFLEQKFGRDAFDAFLHSWFDEHAFQSHTTEDFLAFLDARLLRVHPGLVTHEQVEQWVYSSEMPSTAPVPHAEAFDEVDRQRARWLAGTGAAQIPAAQWGVHEWRRFLDLLPEQVPAARLGELDRQFHLTDTRNSLIARSWLKLAIRHRYRAADAAVERYLVGVGRVRLIKPLYRELLRVPGGRARAEAIFARARSGYHPIAQAAIERLLKEGAGGAD
ncbi:MAG TPA: M1 family metallopeptidase [Candidatus Binatia bacterium]|nr:M1 family metallopeptidase [Candidatus Binatia bacterium]